MLINGIDIKDISVVVQGPINKECTAKYIKTIRKYLPQATIILSTWEGSNVDGINYDEVVFSPDPAEQFSDKEGEVRNNVDRQIVSTINGLKKVKTLYAFKIRTDFTLSSNRFLNFFGKFDKFTENYQIVEKRILACTFATRNPDISQKIKDRYFSGQSLPFHPSDFAFFGLTNDLIKLFDIPIPTEEDRNYFTYYNSPIPKDHITYHWFYCRYVPEQHIMINFLKQNGKTVHCEHCFDASAENIEQTKLWLVNNFTLISNQSQFNLVPFKKHFIAKKSSSYYQTCYTHHDFLKLYKEYCDKSYKIPPYDKERLCKMFYINYRRKLLKPIVNIICIFIPNRRIKEIIRKIYK